MGYKDKGFRGDVMNNLYVKKKSDKIMFFYTFK
jgi:hypothetical protein